MNYIHIFSSSSVCVLVQCDYVHYYPKAMHTFNLERSTTPALMEDLRESHFSRVEVRKVKNPRISVTRQHNTAS